MARFTLQPLPYFSSFIFFSVGFYSLNLTNKCSRNRPTVISIIDILSCDCLAMKRRVKYLNKSRISEFISNAIECEIYVYIFFIVYIFKEKDNRRKNGVRRKTVKMHNDIEIEEFDVKSNTYISS